jgi:RNA polymerase sigma-70 factor (ECF subfamily)
MVGPPPFIKLRSGRPGRIDSRASGRSNSDGIAAPRGTGKEWAVVRQAIAGNARAQEQLFARPARKLYRAVFAVLQNKEDAEDALQDGLCKAFTSLRTFQGRSSFSTWITRIVINSALMARRRKLAHPEASLDEMLDNQPVQLPRGVVDARPDPEKLYAETELIARVEDHVSQLPPALQAPFRLYAIEGISGPESSKALGISPSAFKSRVFRARLKLACGGND